MSGWFWAPFIAEVPFGIWLIVAIVASVAVGLWLALYGWPLDDEGVPAAWPGFVALLGITFWPISVAMAVLCLGCVVFTSPAWAPIALVLGIKALVKRRSARQLSEASQ